MKPYPYNISLSQGDFYTGLLVTLPSLAAVDGPSDLSTATVHAQMRQKEWSTDVLATFDIEIISPTERTFRMTLSAEDSAGLPETAVWDLEVRSGDWVGTIFRGQVSVEQEVTRIDV